ncbi:MAG: ABC transporter ATP-binding protein [Burkholderiales bacterium]|jgi:ATP-binding cassette subfamily B protein
MSTQPWSPREAFAAIRRLWGLLPARHRAAGLRLQWLAVVTGTAEVISLGASLVFLVALSTPTQLLEHPMLGSWLRAAGQDSVADARLAASVAFAATAVAAGLLRMLLIRRITGWANTVGATVDAAIFRRTIHQPYAVHVARHSSEVIAGVTSQSDVVVERVLLATLSLVTMVLMMAVVLGALVAWRPLESIGAFCGFAAIYYAIAMTSRRLLATAGAAVEQSTGRVVRLLQESLGAIRDVLIDGTQSHYSRRFAEETRRLRAAQAQIRFVSLSPRFGIEALGMALIAGIAWVLAGERDSFEGSFAMVGALAIAGQRVLPMLQEAYHAYSALTGAHSTLLDVLVLLEQPGPDDDAVRAVEPLPFREAIRLEQLGFRYGPASPWVLRGVSLEIPRGMRLGIVGASGGGKSTLLDLLVGLQPPVEGRLRVDETTVDDSNRARWQAHVAQVPQSIHLSDCSIEENIAYGVPPHEIDRARVREAARKARIADTIEAMPEGYLSRVGEHGLRLSGGQRQRIGIARALYKQADLLVLDEATSALDTATESEVIDTIEALGRDITVIMVAHRLTTLGRCDRILRVEGGRLVPFDETPSPESAVGVAA